MSQDIARHDQVVHFWCPQLGQTMTFAYCRRAQGGLPCARVVQCFSPHFDVAAFLRQHYAPDDLARCLGPQPGRLDRIADALAGAKGGSEAGDA